MQEQQLNYKAKEVWGDEDRKILLSLQNSYQVIDLKELMYCESDKGYTTFYLSNDKKYTVSKPLKEFEQQLCAFNFIRTHQSFIVNLRCIDRYDKSGVIYLNNNKGIPVSSRKKEYFLSKLFAWIKM